MALNSSGPISLVGCCTGVSIRKELGASGALGMTCASVRGLAGVASGAIVMPGNFYGKSNSNYYANLGILNNAYGFNQSMALAKDSSGNLYLGSGDYPGCGYDYPVLIKYNAQGSISWAYSYCMSSHNYGTALVSLDNSGNIYTQGSGYVAKYNACGTPVWSKNYYVTTVASGSNQFLGMSATDTGGNTYINGTYNVTSTNCAYNRGLVFKIDTNGNVLWSKGIQYYTPQRGYAGGYVGVDPSGNVWSTFYRTQCTSDGSPNSLIVKLCGNNGNLIWAKKFSKNIGVNGSGTAQMYSQPLTFDSYGAAYVPINGGVGRINASGQAQLASYSGCCGYTLGEGSKAKHVVANASGAYVIASTLSPPYNFPGGLTLEKYLNGSPLTPDYKKTIGYGQICINSVNYNYILDNNNDLYLAHSTTVGEFAILKVPTYSSCTTVTCYLAKSGFNFPNPSYSVSCNRFTGQGSQCERYKSTPVFTFSKAGTTTSVATGLSAFSTSCAAVCITSPGISKTCITVSTRGGYTSFISNTASYNLCTLKATKCYTNGSAVFINDSACGTQTYSWIAPTGVTSVSVVAIGQGLGGGGAGGSLAYKNNYAVTPGSSYTVGLCNSSGTTYFVNTSTLKAGGRGNYGYSGCGGGCGGGSTGLNGGGAGGYSGSGGNGTATPTAGSGGGGGGGKCNSGVGGGGGGVNVFGQGSSGAAGTTGGAYTYGGGGGSGGGKGWAGIFHNGCSYTGSQAYGCGGNGGCFGGGGGAGISSPSGGSLGHGGRGALRIVWPGNTRRFPSTCVGAP